MAGERRHERKHFFAGEVGKALEAAMRAVGNFSAGR
jgi:hypothetical protein